MIFLVLDWLADRLNRWALRRQDELTERWTPTVDEMLRNPPTYTWE